MVSVAFLVFFVCLPLIVVNAKLTYSNCGTSSATLTLNSLEIKPHPIKIPVTAQFLITVNLKEDFKRPIKANVRMTKKFLGLNIEVPCQDGKIGTCKHDDWNNLCTSCPEEYPAGVLTMDMPMDVTTAVPTGNYGAKIEFISATGQTGCVQINDIEIKK